MATDVKASVTTSYTYNHAGRLASVVIGGSPKGAYLYNAMGQMVSRTVTNTTPSGTVHYLHDLDGNIIAETDGNGGTVREYIWLEHRGSKTAARAPGSATPLAVIADVDTAAPKLYYAHPDHLDRPVTMTDTAGAVVWAATYQPYGGVHQITGTAANDNRFPGQWYQLESGLNYNWHRQYDPSLGRYTQPDPLGLIDGPNRYAYVGNDPQQMVDPEGRQRSNRPQMSFTPAQNFRRSLHNSLTSQIRSHFPGFGNYTGPGRNYVPSYRRLGQMQSILYRLQTREAMRRSCPIPGGNIWTPTTTRTPLQNAYNHWLDHRLEFPEYRNAKQYVDGAHNFLRNPPMGTLSKSRPNGDTLLYNPRSNTFGVRRSDGTPRTMFRPNVPRYWENLR